MGAESSLPIEVNIKTLVDISIKTIDNEAQSWQLGEGEDLRRATLIDIVNGGWVSGKATKSPWKYEVEFRTSVGQPVILMVSEDRIKYGKKVGKRPKAGKKEPAPGNDLYDKIEAQRKQMWPDRNVEL